MTERKSSSDTDDSKIGIVAIGSLVVTAISDPSRIPSALQQIFFYYRLLPPEWKTKAFWIFERLWRKKLVIISTNPEEPEKIYEVAFKDKKLQKLFDLLPPVDQAIMLQGKSMVDLIAKGLHGPSDEAKKEVNSRYGQRGLNIVNMLTTKDIAYLLAELEEPAKPKIWINKFNEWADIYDSISALVSPADIENQEKIKARILDLAKKGKKDYIIVNLCGNMEGCTTLLKLISDMKDKNELNYSNTKQDISNSGFWKSLRVRINFKK